MADISFSDMQKKYALRMFPCTPVTRDSVQTDNLMSYKIDAPFVYLHAFVVNELDIMDRYSDMSQGMSNALLYLDPHPVIAVMNIAEITSFHVSPGVYFVEDLRPLENRDSYRQYVFVLLSLNS